MPFYQYEPVDSSCDFCNDGFQKLQKMSDDRLTECPECGNEVHFIVTCPKIVDKTPKQLNQRQQEEKKMTKRLNRREEKLKRMPKDEADKFRDFSRKVTKGKF